MSTPDFNLDGVTFEPLTPEEQETPKRTRKPRADKGQSRGPRATTKKLSEQLLVPWATIASGVAFQAPTLSAVMMVRGEKTVDALVSIASDHPRMLEALKKASKVGDATELITTGLHMAIAAGMDMGRIPVDSPLAAVTGLADLYSQTHPQQDANQEHNGSNGFAFGPPPPFATDFVPPANVPTQRG